MYRWSPRATVAALCVTTLALCACAAPPNREIGDAQEALKVAKAAGAELHAKTEYTAATEAYRLANEAVQAGDYRLALNRALESREHAQNATRAAADLHTRAREEVLQSMTDIAELLAKASAEVESAERAHVPRPVVREVRQSLTQVSVDVQKAGEAIRKQDYEGAQAALKGVKERLEKAMASLATGRQAQPTRRPTS